MAGKKGMKIHRGSRTLRDLQRVYQHPAHVPGETETLKTLRDLWVKDPDRFLDRLQKQEQMDLARRNRAGGGGQATTNAAGTTINSSAAPLPPPVLVDEGSDRAEEVISKLLDDFEREHPQAAGTPPG